MKSSKVQKFKSYKKLLLKLSLSLIILLNLNIVSVQSQVSPVIGDFPPDHCYYLHTQCEFQYNIYHFNPGPITLTYSVTARFQDGYTHVYNFSAVVIPSETGPSIICFPVNIPNSYIISVKICTDRNTTDYIVDKVVSNKIYLDMVVPKEATIGGIFYKADPAPLGPIGCQDLWKIQFNNIEWDSIPKWINCQNDINIVFHDNFNLYESDDSGIILQVAVHEYPIVYTDEPLIHFNIVKYRNGDSINISTMLRHLQPGKRYVLSMATVCDDGRLNLGSTKISTVIAKANKVRTLIFDYDAVKTWSGYINLGSKNDRWDNVFPGKIDDSQAPITFITPDDYNSGSKFKYEILKLTSSGEVQDTLYESNFISGTEFFADSSDSTHTFVRLNSLTNNYFFTSQNEYIVINLTTDDKCDYTVRSIYFRTGDGSNLPPEHGDLEEGTTSRSLKGDSYFSLYGNPGRVLNLDFRNNFSTAAQLFVFNSTGRQILRQEIEEGNILIHDSSSWATGLYYIIIKSGDEILTEKWIKQ